jgi:hypothetical protein
MNWKREKKSILRSPLDGRGGGGGGGGGGAAETWEKPHKLNQIKSNKIK